MSGEAPARRSRAQLALGGVPRRQRLALAWTRRVLSVGLVVGAALIIRRYDFEEWNPALGGLGDRVGRIVVVYRALDADAPIAAGTLVEAEGETFVDGRPVTGRFVSRVAGVPGGRVSFEPDAAGRLEIHVDGAPTGAPLPEGAPLAEGVIPEGRFLLIDPAPEAGGIDSRHLGLVGRAQIRRRIVATL